MRHEISPLFSLALAQRLAKKSDNARIDKQQSYKLAAYLATGMAHHHFQCHGAIGWSG